MLNTMRCAMGRGGCGRRSWAGALAALAGGVLGGVGGMATPGLAQSDQPFTMIALPDTQVYSEFANLAPIFAAQTQWAVANRDRLNTRFVSHLGDIVQKGANGGNLSEWIRADAAIDVLDNQLPYGVAIGNHDYNVVSDKASGSDVYRTYFGPQRYFGYPWYMGSSTNGENHAQIFSGGPGSAFQILHLSLEWRPDASTVAWAKSVMAQYPGLPVILSTHEHVRDPDENGAGGGRSTFGQFTWSNLIFPEPRVIMIINGHFASGPTNVGGEYYQVGVNNLGLPVFEMLSDYQRYSNGGNGYLRVLRFDPRHDLLTVRTFSPTLNSFIIDTTSELRFALDFTSRTSLGAITPRIQNLTFRAGEGAYNAMQDVELRQAQPTTTLPSEGSITIDATDGSPAGPTQALIKFDSLFGAGATQINADKDIVLAKLRLNVFEAGSGFTVHRMIAPWSELSTWTTMNGGVSPDGIEAVAGPEIVAGRGSADLNVGRIVVEVDVTASLRMIRDGAANQGWALLPWAGGTDGLDFNASEAVGVTGRPQLVVTTTKDTVQSLTFREGLNGYAGTRDVEIGQSIPSTSIPQAVFLSVDADEPANSGGDTQVLLRFENLFGPGAIPEGSRVTSAMLSLHTVDEGSGMSVHRVLREWSENSTWASLAGGVSTDDAEAEIYPLRVEGIDAAAASVRLGRTMIDVTETVQAWAHGKPNLGWLMKPLAQGSNGLDFASSEASDAATRPTLVVRYIAPPVPCPSDFNADGFVDDADFAEFASRYEAFIAGPDGYGDFNADGFVDDADFVQFALAYEAFACE